MRRADGGHSLSRVDGQARLDFLLRGSPAGRGSPWARPSGISSVGRLVQTAARLGLAITSVDLDEAVGRAETIVRDLWETFPDPGRLPDGSWPNTRVHMRDRAAPLQRAIAVFDVMTEAATCHPAIAALLGRSLDRAVSRADQFLSFMELLQLVVLGQIDQPDALVVLSAADRHAAACGAFGADVDFFGVTTARHLTRLAPMRHGYDAELLFVYQLVAAGVTLTSIPNQRLRTSASLHCRNADFILNGQDGVEVKSCCSGEPANWIRFIDHASDQLAAFTEEYGPDGPLGRRQRYLVIYHDISAAAFTQLAAMLSIDPAFGRTFDRVILSQVIQGSDRRPLTCLGTVELLSDHWRPSFRPFRWAEAG
ncbi:MAG: hypothetical protein HY696_05210 [Deltaproteobacteria bacterium]|nr:hypothetical protein [Deltaproteobacteria bacterium]